MPNDAQPSAPRRKPWKDLQNTAPKTCHDDYSPVRPMGIRPCNTPDSSLGMQVFCEMFFIGIVTEDGAPWIKVSIGDGTIPVSIAITAQQARDLAEAAIKAAALIEEDAAAQANEAFARAAKGGAA